MSPLEQIVLRSLLLKPGTMSGQWDARATTRRIWWKKQRCFPPDVLLIAAVASLLTILAAKMWMACPLQEFREEKREEKLLAHDVVLPETALARDDGPPYGLSVCCLVQQEAPYVAEWIAYHRLLGVDHFFVYDNNSTDDLASVLKPYVDLGWVTLQKLHLQVNQSTDVIASVAEECNGDPKNLSKWLAMFEVDEFMVLVGGREMTSPGVLPRLLKKYENKGCAGLILDRLNFGSGGHREPPEGLVIEQYVERHVADDSKPAGKTIAMTERVEKISHHFLDVADDKWTICLSNLLPWPGKHQPRTMVLEPIRIHHYWTRSWSECMEKLQRRQQDHAGDWRVKQGEKYCNREIRGADEYLIGVHTNDTILSSSIWPELVRAFLLN